MFVNLLRILKKQKRTNKEQIKNKKRTKNISRNIFRLNKEQ